jgi:hypothetical protein
MTFRAGFLIIAAAKFFHLSFSQMCLLLFGYFGFAAVDQWLANRATEKVIDGEVFWLYEKAEVGLVKMDPV